MKIAIALGIVFLALSALPASAIMGWCYHGTCADARSECDARKSTFSRYKSLDCAKYMNVCLQTGMWDSPYHFKCRIFVPK